MLVEAACPHNLHGKYETGEFWTSGQRQANRIHEISYRACFKPQLPGYFIERFTKPADVVYDPFMGRGTTLIEAALRGRTPYGNDLSPLSRVLVEPRINPPSVHQVEARLQQIPWQEFKHHQHDELLVFYHQKTLAQLQGLRLYFGRRQLDKTDAWIQMAAVSRLSGHSPGFFSVYTMPPNQAVSLERQKIINLKRQQKPEYRDVPKLIMKKSKRLLSGSPPRALRTLFLTQRSEHTPQIQDAEVALTVTSPPFLDVVDYRKDNWLRNWFLGAEEQADLSIYRSVPDWEKFTRRTLRELARITKPGGHVAYEVGEVRNGSLNLEEVVAAAADGLPLKVETIYINKQKFTKTANCWGVKNNSQGTNTNRVVLFRRCR